MDLTLEEEASKLDTDVAVPPDVTPVLYLVRNLSRLQVYQGFEHTNIASKPDYDVGNAEEEGLDPVLQQLFVESDLVPSATNRGARLELYPVNRFSLVRGLCVPDCVGESGSDI